MRRLTPACILAVSFAAAAADPEAELPSGAAPSAVTIKGTAQGHYRLAPGKAFTLQVAGPAKLRFDVRLEGEPPPKAVAAVIEMDGKLLSRTGVGPAADPDGKSDKDKAVTRPVAISATVPAGAHAVSLKWADGAPADALVAIGGVKLVAPGSLKVAALPALPGAGDDDPTLPAPALPAAAGKDAKKSAREARLAAAAPALPGLPGLPDAAPAPAAAKPALPLPGADAAPALPGLADAPAAEAREQGKSKKAKKGDKAALPSLPGLPEAPAEGKAEAKAEPKLPEARPAEAPKPAEIKTAEAPRPAEPKKDVKPPAADAVATATRETTKPAESSKTAEPTSSVKTLTATPVSSGVADRGAPSSPAAGLVARDGDTRTWASQRDQDRLWSVTAYGGVERSDERYISGYASHTHLGIEGTRAFATHWMALSGLDYRASEQGYIINVPGGSTAPQMLPEQRYDFRLGIGYDYGPRLLESGRLAVMPVLSFHYLGIRNKAFPADLLGPELGVRARFELSSAIILHAQIAYTYNLASTSTQSAVGDPQGDFGARVGLALPLAGGYALQLDYVNDVLSFQNVFRVAHGAALGFGYIF